jgi:hypothetical protein
VTADDTRLAISLALADAVAGLEDKLPGRPPKYLPRWDRAESAVTMQCGVRRSG